MALMIAESIRKREFGREISATDIDVLKRSARASLAVQIKGEGLPKGTRLLKAYATSPQGPRRIVYLLNTAEGNLFLLFYRDKNDEIGKNITLANETFRKRLATHLDLLVSDIEAGRIQIIETE